MATLVLSNVMKKFENLNVIDNFMFNELETQTDRESAKEFIRILLETILEKKVSNIHIFSQQLEQGRMPGMHGIQMDSYVEACVGEGEDVENMIFPIKPEVFDIEAIQKMMDKIKRSSEIGVRYMQSWEIKQICHDEGYDEGYSSGYSEGHDIGYGEGYGEGYGQGYDKALISIVQNKKAKGLTPAEIADILEITDIDLITRLYNAAD